MPSQATFNGSGDMGSDSANEQKRFSVPLASVAKSTQKLHVTNIPVGMEESGKPTLTFNSLSNIAYVKFYIFLSFYLVLFLSCVHLCMYIRRTSPYIQSIWRHIIYIFEKHSKWSITWWICMGICNI